MKVLHKLRSVVMALAMLVSLTFWPMPGGYAAPAKPSMPLKISYPVDLFSDTYPCPSGREITETDSADEANAAVLQPQATFVYWSNAPTHKDKPIMVGIWHWDVKEMEWLFDLDRNGFADEILDSEQAQEKYGDFCGAVDKVQ